MPRLSCNYKVELFLLIPFTFSKDVQWAGLESLLGQFWTLSLMFDSPALSYCTFGTILHMIGKTPHFSPFICVLPSF